MLSLQQLIVGGGSGTFAWFLIFILMYLSIKAIRWLLTPPDKRPHYSSLTSFIKNILLWGLILAALSIMMQLVLTFIFTTVPENHVADTSVWLMHADVKIFDTFPALKLYAYLSGTFIERLIVYSYNYLAVIIALLFFIAFIQNRKLFITFFTAFIFAFLISAPMWYFVPAVSPEEAYRRDTVSISNSSHYSEGDKAIQEHLQNQQQSAFLAKYINSLDKRWISPDKSYYAVSSFPSLHAAWGVIGMVLAFYLWPPLLIVALPWCILNFVGTFYTLQHYAIDSMVGICVGVLCILLSLFLSKKLSAQQGSNLRPSA